ncbi:sodium:solute symporter [Rhizobium sp. BK068]|uniref:sodium:solute symporter family transporter n=1 Tax=Rhizobium sp. BK068 TaxID=2512130 RepID=UPI001045ADA7|nr:sodium:solute symporter [Rhizobium sp. BK068]TCM76698.1 Na+/proline symporter [Rhizobium sp. BK068]
MNKEMLVSGGLPQLYGYLQMILLAFVLLVLSYTIKRIFVRNTHGFIIANRQVGFGFGVGAVISAWTYAMAVLMSAGMTFQWGLSGLLWFVVPNGFAVIAMIPFARILRRSMPNGYTIPEFIRHRFKDSKLASGVVTLTVVLGAPLAILINLKGLSIVMSVVFGIKPELAATVGILCILAYSYFGGLWTSVITGTLNTLMLTVPSAIVVVAVYHFIPGGADAVFSAVGEASPQNLSVLRADAAAGFGITLAFGLLTAIGDQALWQKVWSIRSREVTRVFFWAGALFYPIPIAAGMLGLVGIAYGLTPADIGGDIVAIGPYIVSHLGLPLILVLLYCLTILAASYSSIDAASSALSSVVAVDIVRRLWPDTNERRLFLITKVSILSGGAVGLAILLTGIDFTSLVLTESSLRTAILIPFVLAIVWSRTNTIGFVSGVVLSIIIGQTVRYFHGELWGTLTTLGVSGGTVLISGLLDGRKFDMASLQNVRSEIGIDSTVPAPIGQFETAKV